MIPVGVLWTRGENTYSLPLSIFCATGQREEFLCIYSFQDLECLNDVPLINLLRYVKNAGWFLWESKANSSQ